MWNSRKLLYLKIKSGRVKIILPLPIIVLFHICDYLEDLMVLFAFITPKINISINHNKYPAREGILLVKKMIGTIYQIKYCEPFDLVDITTKDAVVKISIK